MSQLSHHPQQAYYQPPPSVPAPNGSTAPSPAHSTQATLYHPQQHQPSPQVAQQYYPQQQSQQTPQGYRSAPTQSQQYAPAPSGQYLVQPAPPAQRQTRQSSAAYPPPAPPSTQHHQPPPNPEPSPFPQPPPPVSSSSAPTTWEGCDMLDLYIVDYLSKRNLSLSAQSLLAETGLIEGQNAKDLKVPIDARQGLLYEWWTVFWELFTAKNNDGGKPDAKVYVDSISVPTPLQPSLPTDPTSLSVSSYSQLADGHPSSSKPLTRRNVSQPIPNPAQPHLRPDPTSSSSQSLVAPRSNSAPQSQSTAVVAQRVVSASPHPLSQSQLSSASSINLQQYVPPTTNGAGQQRGGAGATAGGQGVGPSAPPAVMVRYMQQQQGQQQQGQYPSMSPNPNGQMSSSGLSSHSQPSHSYPPHPSYPHPQQSAGPLLHIPPQPRPQPPQPDQMQLLQARPPIPPTPTGESSQYSLQHSPHPLPSAPPPPSQPAAGQSRGGGGQLTPFHYEQLGLKMQIVNASLVLHVLDKIGLGGGRDTLSFSPEEKSMFLSTYHQAWNQQQQQHLERQRVAQAQAAQRATGGVQIVQVPSANGMVGGGAGTAAAAAASAQQRMRASASGSTAAEMQQLQSIELSRQAQQAQKLHAQQQGYTPSGGTKRSMSPPPNGEDLMVVDGGNKRARKTSVAANRSYPQQPQPHHPSLSPHPNQAPHLRSASHPQSPQSFAQQQQQQRPQLSGEAGSPPQMNGNMVGGKPVMRRRVTNGSNATIYRQPLVPPIEIPSPAHSQSQHPSASPALSSSSQMNHSPHPMSVQSAIPSTLYPASSSTTSGLSPHASSNTPTASPPTALSSGGGAAATGGRKHPHPNQGPATTTRSQHPLAQQQQPSPHIQQMGGAAPTPGSILASHSSPNPNISNPSYHTRPPPSSSAPSSASTNPNSHLNHPPPPAPTDPFASFSHQQSLPPSHHPSPFPPPSNSQQPHSQQQQPSIPSHPTPSANDAPLPWDSSIIGVGGGGVDGLGFDLDLSSLPLDTSSLTDTSGGGGGGMDGLEGLDGLAGLEDGLFDFDQWISGGGDDAVGPGGGLISGEGKEGDGLGDLGLMDDLGGSGAEAIASAEDGAGEVAAKA